MAEVVATVPTELEGLLVPLDALVPLEGNPRRGVVSAVAASYARFGQRKPIVARRTNGRRSKRPRGEVLSGNHQLAAARELGWTHIAVVWTDDDDVEAKAFALADNRTHDLGDYDDALLAEMVRSVAEASPDAIAAAGFSEDDVADLLDALADGAVAPTLGNVLDDGRTPAERAEEYITTGLRSLILTYPSDSFAELVGALGKLRAKLGEETNAAVVATLIRRAHADLGAAES